MGGSGCRGRLGIGVAPGGARKGGVDRGSAGQDGGDVCLCV